MPLSLEQLVKDPRFMFNVLDTMRDGMMVIDEDGKIFYFNKAAEEISGFAAADVIGQSCMILDSDTCVVLTSEGKQKRCNLFKDGQICNKRCRIRAKDGKGVYLLKNAVVLKDDNGEIIGAVETMTDVTTLYLKELELEELKEELRQEYWFMGLLGQSAVMQKLYELIRNAAGSKAPVLIHGESGTGKNLVANAVHALSRRKEHPFIKMNCAAINEHLLESELFGHKKGSFTGAMSDRVGRFQAADGGSILLDEIGDMPPLMQAKLLRVLEEKVVERVGENIGIPVDVRVISATNRDLPELVGSGQFREDLYYRVNAIPIRTPSLREHPEDIPVLAAHSLKKISIVNNKEVRRINPRAMDLLCHYHWPGNVRQLISVLEHCAITCRGDTVEITDLPDYLFVEKSGEPAVKENEHERILKALALFNDNKTLAAKHLGISRVTLWKKLKALREE